MSKPYTVQQHFVLIASKAHLPQVHQDDEDDLPRLVSQLSDIKQI